MLLDKLPWCTHSNDPIFSVHVQPGGQRFATGGGDTTVKVWSLAAALDARHEENAAAPKLLATLTEHNGSVNAVRFSPSGRQLASGSDDAMACIYELRPGAGGGVLGGEANVENWRIRLVLRGHSSHVVDVAWSPDGGRLATAALDSTVIVWDAATGQAVTTLRAHTSFVKGVAWDPVGTYLATQSEDKSVAVWRADDWSLVATVRAPFARIVTATFAARLAWAPDGQHLLAGNSYQGATHAAVAVPRGAWDDPAQYLLVSGHGGAVVAAAFCPRLMRLPGPAGGPPSEELSAVFALGGQDKRVTVWAAAAQRPLFCGSRLFRSQVVDLAWTPDGRCLLACSSDGTVACMQFDKSEIGEPATEAEMGEVMRSLYGAAAGRPGKRVFAESAEQLQLEEGEAGPSAAIGGPSPARPALAAVQRPAAAKPAAAAPDALAALDARLGGRLGAGAVTHTGFGSAPGATVTAAPAAAERRVASASGGALMPPPAPRPVAQPPAAAQHVGEPAAKPAAKRPRAEAAPGGGATAAQSMLLSVPKAQPELRVQMGRAPALLGAAAGAAVELRVSNKERGAGGVPQAELCCSRGGSEAWRDVVGGAHVVAAAGTPHFCAAATADGQLLLYSAAGRRLAAPLKLGAGIVLLAAGAGWRLLALTSSGAVRLLDVERLEQVLEAGAGPLLEGGASVLDARLSRSGAPILTLSDCRAFVWHAGLRAWMCAADDSLAASQYAPLLRLADQGELSALQAEALAGGPSGLSGSGGGGGSSSGASAAQRALSRAHVEGSLAAAAALRSPDEYRRWLVTYARCLAEAGDAGRLSELCDSLAGPAPGEEPVEGEEEGGAQGEPADGARAPPRWCPTVLGLSKRALLRGEVLREVARNRSLGTLLQRCRQVLDAVEAAEADGADGDAAASP